MVIFLVLNSIYILRRVVTISLSKYTNLRYNSIKCKYLKSIHLTAEATGVSYKLTKASSLNFSIPWNPFWPILQPAIRHANWSPFFQSIFFTWLKMNAALKVSPAPRVSTIWSGGDAVAHMTSSFLPAAAPLSPQAQTIMALWYKEKKIVLHTVFI